MGQPTLGSWTKHLGFFDLDTLNCHYAEPTYPYFFNPCIVSYFPVLRAGQPLHHGTLFGGAIGNYGARIYAHQKVPGKGDSQFIDSLQ